MKEIINQQLFLSIKNFFNEMFDQHRQDAINSNDVVEFINNLKEQETFLDEQGLYNENEFLECIEYNFDRTGVYQLFSNDKKEASKIIREIFSNGTRFSSYDTDNIEKVVKKYYDEANIDQLMKSGNDIVDKNHFSSNNFPNASQYILDLSQKIESHKIKEGLGIVYSVVLKDDEKTGEKALNEDRKAFFDFINSNIVGADEKVFDYNAHNDEVDVHLCSHRSVFDAFLRNQRGQYSILIATNSHDSKAENETAFTQPISALYVVHQIENKLLPILDGEFDGIQHLIDFQHYSNTNRIEFLKSEVPEKLNEYSRLKNDVMLGIKQSNAYKGEVVINVDNNPVFEALKDSLENEQRPGPELKWANHIEKMDNEGNVALSKYLTKHYIDALEKDIEQKLSEQERLIEENNNDNLLVRNHFVDFSNVDDLNVFIANNLELMHELLPDDLKLESNKTKTFRTLVHHLDNNTGAILKELGINYDIDDYNNLLLNKDSINDLTQNFEDNNLTVRFYGKNQGKRNHAYLNEQEQENVSKEAVCYVLGQYTYLDYLMTGKNGVKMDFEGGCDYIENILLKNTITETDIKNSAHQSKQVIFHQKINDPEYTRNILGTIMNDYIFNADKEKVLSVFDKNDESGKSLDEVTLNYINSVSEAFWSDFSSRIDNTMTPQQINKHYFEFCSNMGIKVTESFENVLAQQIEINNSPRNNKARNGATIASLNNVNEIYERCKLNTFMFDKEKEEVEKLFSMGMTQEQVQQIKPDLSEDFFNDLNISDSPCRKNRPS